MSEEVIGFEKYCLETVNYGIMNTVHRKVYFLHFGKFLNKIEKSIVWHYDVGCAQHSKNDQMACVHKKVALFCRKKSPDLLKSISKL